MRDAVTAYIGLGSNQDNPVGQVRRALDELAALPEIRLCASSRLYKSAPLGPVDQADFINAVAALETRLSPDALLAVLQSLEARHGRMRSALRWGPRPLDLDLLLYGDAVIDSPDLQVPHPGLPERVFVLYPLAEIAPDLAVPGRGTVTELLQRCAPAPIEVLGDTLDE
jgi:2-amino-4-hydroxy-6-hydroxymethyldihydropteridine diphosphokinase